jgi:hypothetical protein
MADPVSVEAIIAERVAERVRAELAPVLAALGDLQRRLPPQLGDVAQASAATGLSPASIRRRIKDGSLPTVKVGSRRLVDLAALRPPSPEEIAKLAREARG